jgi:hypothetical protein
MNKEHEQEGAETIADQPQKPCHGPMPEGAAPKIFSPEGCIDLRWMP